MHFILYFKASSVTSVSLDIILLLVVLNQHRRKSNVESFVSIVAELQQDSLLVPSGYFP